MQEQSQKELRTRVNLLRPMAISILEKKSKAVVLDLGEKENLEQFLKLSSLLFDKEYWEDTRERF